MSLVQRTGWRCLRCGHLTPGASADHCCPDQFAVSVFVDDPTIQPDLTEYLPDPDQEREHRALEGEPT